MLIIAVLLSISILIFCVLQAYRLLSPFASLESEFNAIQNLIADIDSAADLKSRIGQTENQHPVSLALARQLRHSLSKDAHILHGRTGWVIDMETLFDADLMLRNHMEIRKVQVMPSLLTGLGIFFTFMGLTFATLGLDPTDAVGLTSSVKQLVGGMSLAFSTSLTGIGTSLWWTWKQKSIEQMIESQCYQLKESLRSKIFVFSEQEWYLMNQEEHRRMMEAVPSTIETAMVRALKSSLPKSPESFPVEQFEKLFENLLHAVRNQTDSLKEVLEHMSGGSTRSGVDGNQQEQTINQMQQMVTDMIPLQQGHLEVVASVKQAVLSLAEMSQQATNSQKTLTKSQDEMNGNLKMIREFWQTYRGQLNQLESSLNDGIKGFKDHMKETMHLAHSKLDEILSESLAHFSGTLLELDRSLNSLSVMVETLNQMGEKKKKKGIFR